MTDQGARKEQCWLFYREGTDEFQRTLGNLPPSHREKVLKKIDEIADNVERGQITVTGKRIAKHVYCHKFSPDGVAYRLFVKEHIETLKGTEFHVALPVYIVKRSEEKEYDDFCKRVKESGIEVSESTRKRIRSLCEEHLREHSLELPPCPEEVRRFLDKLHTTKLHDFFEDTIVVYESEDFCEWVSEKDDTFLSLLHDKLFKLIGNISNQTTDSGRERHDFDVGHKKEAFDYRVTTEGGHRRLYLYASNAGGSESSPLRAYPSYILADEELWKAIEKGKALSLPLSREEQELLGRILNQQDLPVFISGRAGSGKSTMLYYLFANYWYKMEEFREKIIFLTYTETLRKNAFRQIKCIIDRMAGEEHPVEFREEDSNIKTLRNFLREVVAGVEPEASNEYAEHKYMDFNKFRAILSGRYDLKISPDVCWHVIRTYIKGYYHDKEMQPEDYEKLIPEEKTVTLGEFEEAYKVYQWIRKNPPTHWDELDLARKILQRRYLDNHKYYMMIFCDEAQDFTRVEFELIFRLGFASRYDFGNIPNLVVPIILAGDPLQTVNPTGFRPESLKTSLYLLVENIKPEASAKKQPSYYELKQNYRSSEDITKFSNLVNLLRFNLLNRNSGEHSEPQSSWRKSHEIPAYVSLDNFNLTVSPEDFHIVIHPELKEQIRQNPGQHTGVSKLLPAGQEGAPNLWTPLEIKGLEQDYVIVYGFGEMLARLLEPRFRAQPKSLANPEFRKEIANRIKGSNSTDLQIQMHYFFSNLYVAITRPVKRLFIVDTDKGREILWDLMLTEEKWEELLLQVKGDEWSKKENFQGLIEVGQISAKPIDPKKEAREALERWREERNLSEGRRAIQWLDKLGRHDEAKKLRAQIYEYEEEWSQAAKAYEEAREYEMAAKCWLRTGKWEETSRILQKCDSIDLVLEWARSWTEIWDHLAGRVSHENEDTQQEWISSKVFGWLAKTDEVLKNARGDDKEVVREESNKLLREMLEKSRLKSQARRYLKEQLLEQYEGFLNSLNPQTLKMIVNDLRDEYLRSKRFDKFVYLSDKYNLEKNDDYYWALAHLRNLREGVGLLLERQYYDRAVRLWEEHSWEWDDAFSDLAYKLTDKGHETNVIRAAILNNRLEDLHSDRLSQILSKPEEKRMELVKLVQDLTKQAGQGESFPLKPLFFVSLTLHSRDETYDILGLCLQKNIPPGEIAKLIRNEGEWRFLIAEVLRQKAFKKVKGDALPLDVKRVRYLLEAIHAVKKPSKYILGDLEEHLPTIFSNMYNICQEQISCNLSELKSEIESIVNFVKRYISPGDRKTKILERIEQLSGKMGIGIESPTEITQVLDGQKCKYKVTVASNENIPQGEDDKAYFFIVEKQNSTFVVRLLKSERKMLCVNRDTGDSKAFFRSMKTHKHEPLWDIGTISVSRNEAVIKVDGEKVMTVVVL